MREGGGSEGGRDHYTATMKSLCYKKRITGGSEGGGRE